MKEITSNHTFTSFESLQRHAQEQNEKLTVMDFNRGSIKLNHSDGTKFQITNFITERVSYTNGKTITEPVIIVYSEHHLPLVYFLSDLDGEPVASENTRTTFQEDFDEVCKNHNIERSLIIVNNHTGVKTEEGAEMEVVLGVFIKGSESDPTLALEEKEIAELCGNVFDRMPIEKQSFQIMNGMLDIIYDHKSQIENESKN